ncbi:hypothetical protein V1280_006910 [Bradyrhizobium sp. AZCC 2230]
MNDSGSGPMRTSNEVRFGIAFEGIADIKLRPIRSVRIARAWSLFRERRLHRLPCLDRLVVGVELDVAPAYDLAMGDVVPMGQSAGRSLSG